MRRTLPQIALAAAVTAGLVVVALAGCASAQSAGSSGKGSATATRSTAPAAATAASCQGVFVTVQFGLLGSSELNACAKTSGPITAADALKAAKVTTSGTHKYGDQVVCRVNGEPSASKPINVPGHSAYTETCQSMPAAFAYWAVWVRDSAAGKWGYAQNGIASEQLQPGQTLGLKFTTGTDTTPPQG